MHAPTIGILAGMGPSSTGPFIDLVVSQCRRQFGALHDDDFPKMVVLSQPAPFRHTGTPDHDALQAATVSGLQDLETSGADVIGIACNSVHRYFAALEASISTPLLNIVTEGLDALPAGTGRIAVAASRPAAESGLLSEAARARGLQVVEPPWQDVIDLLQDLVHEDGREDQLRGAWDELFGRIPASDRPDAVLLACLDLSGAFRLATPDLPVVDGADALAAALVRWWLAHGTTGSPAAADPLGTVAATERGDYMISADHSRLDLDAIHAYLTRSYWAGGISRELVARSVGRSVCFGLYEPGGDQVGFARLVTDRATFAYLADVYVLEGHQGLGLGKALVDAVLAHPVSTAVRRLLLITRDAHGLYRSRGFDAPAAPDGIMEIARPGLYLSPVD